MKISLIAAMDENRVIGRNNDIPWNLPRDSEYVKEKTEGFVLILGRKNLNSIRKPLRNRRNIVLTRHKDVSFEGCEIAHTKEEAMEMCRGEEEVFIFGGAEIYRLFLPMVETMYLTKIHASFKGDTYFPEVDPEEWIEVSREKGITDQNNPYTYYFHVYKRKHFPE
ncbi:dihydrofolate reductase [Peribacillus sp. SCS-37]|uniref:dihydrofolate reductase n=1 Tax=Paraperibacillus esterisolvens TaxID=3115296 RepID=UPI003906206C